MTEVLISLMAPSSVSDFLLAAAAAGIVRTHESFIQYYSTPMHKEINLITNACTNIIHVYDIYIYIYMHSYTHKLTHLCHSMPRHDGSEWV